MMGFLKIRRFGNWLAPANAARALPSRVHSERGDGWRRRAQNDAHCRGVAGSVRPESMFPARAGGRPRHHDTTRLEFSGSTDHDKPTLYD